MERTAVRSRRLDWETPGFEEIGVSAEAAAYAGRWPDEPDVRD